MPSLTLSEDFSRFFESPSREGLRELLRNRTGEYDFYDFKALWSEPAEVARDILGFANSGSGCMVVGVAENDDGSFDVAGVPCLEDKTKLKQRIQKYLPPTVEFDIHDFEYRDSDYAAIKGKRFQVLLVVRNPLAIPVLAIGEKDSLKRNRIYIREGTRTVEANHAAVQSLIKARLDASAGPDPNQIRDLNQHLSELQALYAHLPTPFSAIALVPSISPMGGFHRFVEQMIQKKKAIIGRILE